MPLRFSGESGSSENHEKLLEAFDGETQVWIVSSREAIADYGLPAVQKKAPEKYDANEVDHSGRVVVFSIDVR